MRRIVAVVLMGALLGGCGIVQQRELAAKRALLREQSAMAMKECGEKYPPGNSKTAVARAQCMNGAFTILQPTLPYPDLLQVFMADHVAIAEEVQAGRTTIVQANSVIARKWSEIVAEEQRRNLANRSVAAQENVAAASLQAAGSRTCTAFGNSVTCF